MPTRKRATYVNPQQRATEFQVGQSVTHWGHSIEESGRVTAVWPAIGQVDVQFAWGNIRVPVEDLQIIADNTWVVTPKNDNTPGGTATAVPGGPFTLRDAPYDPLPIPVKVTSRPSGLNARSARTPSLERVVVAYVKKAIYWQEKNRKYRVSQGELDSGSFHCPRCKETVLRDAIYKREEGQSVRLLGCPSCLFLVRKGDLLGVETPSTTVEVTVPQGKSMMISLLRGE